MNKKDWFFSFYSTVWVSFYLFKKQLKHLLLNTMKIWTQNRTKDSNKLKLLKLSIFKVPSDRFYPYFCLYLFKSFSKRRSIIVANLSCLLLLFIFFWLMNISSSTKTSRISLILTINWGKLSKKLADQFNSITFLYQARYNY